MKVLYVVGTNLSRNTSANISHNAYVQGLLENNCEVDILMASSSWGEKDSTLPTWKEATYFTYPSVALHEKLKVLFKYFFDAKISNDKVTDTTNLMRTEKTVKASKNGKIRGILKKIYDFLSNSSDAYHLERTWLKNASKFKNRTQYDIIISNSTPAASHKLVLRLLGKKNIVAKRWIQIWEDPWFFDLYADHGDEIKQEEHQLLKAAQEIYYVSPLTLKYQKTHFPDCAEKMKHLPLPFLKFGDDTTREHSTNCVVGYFGDYYSKTRNLIPFYQAVEESGAQANIFGDSDLFLKVTDRINISRRVTLDKLAELQDTTGVLVHLCNLKGGQIPGKIYHYSATRKPILFILDGTEEEKAIIKKYFQSFNRYHFCNNTKEEILKVLNELIRGKEDCDKEPVMEFHPRTVVSKLL